MDVAASTAPANDHATYQMAIYLTDVNQANPANDLNLYQLQSLTGDLSDGGAASSAAATGHRARDVHQQPPHVQRQQQRHGYSLPRSATSPP